MSSYSAHSVRWSGTEIFVINILIASYLIESPYPDRPPPLHPTRHHHRHFYLYSSIGSHHDYYLDQRRHYCSHWPGKFSVVHYRCPLLVCASVTPCSLVDFLEITRARIIIIKKKWWREIVVYIPMSIDSLSLESEHSTSSVIAFRSSLEKLNNGGMVSQNFGSVPLECPTSPEKSTSLTLL